MPGAEVDLQRATELDDAELSALGIAGGPWLLVECPLIPRAADDVAAELRALAARGPRVVLAHPERSPAFQHDPWALEALVSEGMATCITAGALRGRFGESARAFAAALVREGLAHVVASDAHERAPPVPQPRAGAAAAGLGALGAALTATNPAAILKGTEPIAATG